MVELFQNFSPFEDALHVFDKMPYLKCHVEIVLVCDWLVS